MALKRKKLDAICAHLKKTSAVDVTTPTEHNGVNGGDGDIVAAVADDGGVDGVAGGGGVKDIVKPIITTSTTTTNNNEETVTDLNENPEPVSSETDPSNNENDSAKLPPPPESAEEEPSSSCLSPSAHFAKSLEDSTSTPTTTTPVLASSITTSISNTPTSSSNVPVSSLETSSDVSPPSSKAETSTSVPTPSASSTKIHGSGRRKSRKAAKPRSVFHPHPVDVEMYEGGSQVSMLGGGSVDDEGSSSFIMGEDLHNGVDSSEEFNDASSYAEREKRSSSPLPSSSSFASQYSSLLQQHQRVKQSIPNFLYPPSPAAGDGDGGGDDDDGDDDDDDGDDSSFNLTGVPLDLSTSRHSDNSEPSFFDNDDNDDETADHSSNSSTRPSSASSSPAPGQHPSYPPPSVSSTVVNAEAKVLADYAKNTMNELLSIYGFGTAGGVESVDKQLAQKQLENLSSLRALAAGTQGKISATPPAAHRVGGGGIKLSNGQPVHRDASASTSNVSSSSEGISNSISALGLVSTDAGQLKKPNGNSTKFKFHNVKPSLKHSFGNTGFHQKVSSSDYSKYIKKFHSGADCGGNHCRDLGYRDHYHCHDCNFKVFIKKEEMVRHYKWHKKRDESLQHGFLRFSPLDDCTVKYGSCTHNKRQTHYHCVQAGCDKVYISTSDVQMHANYHRKDSAIIQEGFQRFRATEDCGTTTCSFYGQRTTHFHCRRPSCNFTFKNKADMEKHKSYHQKDEILGRDGFKKFMKYEHCSFQGCRFSKVSNHIHCIRPGCCYVLHSTAQLYSHKRKHERREFENLYRTFRQAQRPQVQPSAAPAQRSGQQNPRPLAPAVAGIPAGAVSLGTKVNLTSIPIGSYGEPMVARTVVAGQLMQPMSIPIKIGAGGAILAPNVSVVSAGAQTLPTASAAAAIMEAKPLALTTPSSTQTKPTASSSAGAANKAPAITIKQEPKSEGESDTESQSVTKSTGTSPLPFSLPANLETVKSENLNDSLNLAIPVSKEAEEALKQGVVVKSVAESGIGTDGASPVGGKESSITMTLLPPMKRAGAPEKRERDETWKNYLIRYTANDPCNSRCQLLYKDHYHCKIQGCMVLFRSKDGVREHAKFHDLQDRITPMVYDKYDSDIACPHLNCQFCRKEMHYHCNFTGCSHAVADQGQTFARLEHYRIHEFARAAAGKNYRVQSGAGTTVRMDDLAHRRRGRPPKYPRLDIPSVPKVELTEQEIRESSQRTLDGEGAGADERIINGFRKFDAEEECPNDQCIYRGKLHYHCGRPRCHTATDRIDVLNLHAKDFHCFVKILEHFEFFDRNVNCRRSHCNNNGTNRHYHCTRPRCDYSFVRHSTMTQHDKKHNSDVSSSSSSSASAVASSTPLSPGTRITPIQLLRRPDGQTYFPIIPAPAAAALDKSVVKASGTFYPLSALGTSVSGTTVTMVSSAGQALSSGLTLTIPANLMTAGIPVMASMASTSTASSTATNMVPIIAGNVISSGTGAVTSAVPLTVLLQQKSANGMPQPSWSAMRSSMHYSLQASCGRPFCKLKKKDHYHCLECNQAFSDPARLRSHISKHGVKFKKLAQSPSKANIQAPIFLPAAAIKAAGQVMSQGGLDLSKAKLKDSQAEKARAEEGVGGQGEEMVEDDNDSLSSSLNLSVGNFASLTQGDNTVTSASETNDESSLIIDEEAVHSDDESTAMDESINGNEDDGEDEDDMLSTSDISLMASTSAASSPTTSRRSGRKRSAPKNDDFVSSDDASLLAKQMKLKLSAPIPSSTPAPPVARKVPDGFIRFHCSNDCGYLRCAYRQSVTHYHCVRRECGYGFSDKSRILQHQFRHERLDKLMGEEFQQYRATVGCGQEDCEFSEKASHFHCQKCTFVCADSSKVLAHRKYHAKMDNISSNGFQKFGALQRCEIPMCAYSRKQTHYHCTHDGCNHAVLGPAQMAPHKLKHASHDV